MDDKKIFKRYHYKKLLIDFLSLVVLIILLIFGEYLFDYFKNASPPGTYTHTQDMKAIAFTIIFIPLVFIPRAIELVKIILDLILKKQRTIKVTGIKKPSAPWDMREDYVHFYAKTSSKLPHRFVVFKDIYLLKGKKITNTYEVTYYVFSKVVTDMKKCKKDT